jgi:hypothetical protein
MSNQPGPKTDPKSEPKPVPQCSHIKTSGLRCGCPAVSGHSTCYFHTSARQRRANPRSVPFPILEDQYAIQSAIMHVIDLYAARQITYHDVHIYMKLLSLAVRNGRNLNFDSKEARAGMVTWVDSRPDVSQSAPQTQQDATQTNAAATAQPKPPQSAPAPRPNAAQNPSQHPAQNPAQNQRQNASPAPSPTNNGNGAGQNNASQPAAPSLVDALAIAERLLKNAS